MPRRVSRFGPFAGRCDVSRCCIGAFDDDTPQTWRQPRSSQFPPPPLSTSLVLLTPTTTTSQNNPTTPHLAPCTLPFCPPAERHRAKTMSTATSNTYFCSHHKQILGASRSTQHPPGTAQRHNRQIVTKLVHNPQPCLWRQFGPISTPNFFSCPSVLFSSRVLPPALLLPSRHSSLPSPLSLSLLSFVRVLEYSHSHQPCCLLLHHTQCCQCRVITHHTSDPDCRPPTFHPIPHTS